MKDRVIELGNRLVGDSQPVYIIGEIGINHNGSLDIVKLMIDGAVNAGVDCVKFQKRTPDLCVPDEQRNVERDTPWGRMTYIDYRYKVELSVEDYKQIDDHCRKKGVHWTVSCWDQQALSDIVNNFEVPFLKAASASLTDIELLQQMSNSGVPLMLSSGMSTFNEIASAMSKLDLDNILLAHATSAYPCALNELNLRMISTLRNLYPGVPIGYSGHETGLATTYAAVALGASFVERHITLDRAMWGSDQAASIEMGGLARLVRDIRDIESALGDGVKRVYDSELKQRQKLRKVQSTELESV